MKIVMGGFHQKWMEVMLEIGLQHYLAEVFLIFNVSP
jgi:hypothetical protein